MRTYLHTGGGDLPQHAIGQWVIGVGSQDGRPSQSLTAIAIPTSDSSDEWSNENYERKEDGNEKLAKGTLRTIWSIRADDGRRLEINKTI